MTVSMPLFAPDKIVKRDGTLVDFDFMKIVNALSKAGKSTNEFTIAEALVLTTEVLSSLTTSEDWYSVEMIQDKVEDVLLNSKYKKTAKAYIIYRDQHTSFREISEQSDINHIDKYLGQMDWKVKENSNMAYSLQGLNNYISTRGSEVYWLNKIYTKKIKEAHLSGDLHIHDLGLLSVYCVGWDLQDLLRSGFKGVSGKSESKPPKHLRSALGQVVNFIYTLQGEAAGAQAFSNFDTLLAPFIRYDKLSYKQVKQALQEFVFNMNVPTRVGFQSPFFNVTMDLQPPANMAKQAVIMGGELTDDCYGDFKEEMNIFNKAFLEVLTEGDAKGRVFTFPIPTYNITSDFNWDDEGLNPLWEVTAKYGIPYFANFVNSDMSPDDAKSMCCRLRLDVRALEKRGGGLFGANPLTGSIGVVTINMPSIGYTSTDEASFLNELSNRMDLAKDSLETKRKVLEKLTAGGLYPYTLFYLRDVFARFKKYWSNHFSTIGLVGMNEACINLFGVDIGTEKGNTFALRVMDFMRDKLTKYQEETGNLYNLEATPAEGTSYRLARLDCNRYKDIRTAGVEGKEPFYTNSTQLPVNYTDNIFKALTLQDTLQAKYTGGTVQHIFLGEAVPDIISVKNFVKAVCANYTLPYFSLTPSFSICPIHGYINGEVELCPICNEETEIYSRVVGYLRPVKQWNIGKQEEFALRSKFHI